MNARHGYQAIPLADPGTQRVTFPCPICGNLMGMTLDAPDDPQKAQCPNPTCTYTEFYPGTDDRHAQLVAVGQFFGFVDTP